MNNKGYTLVELLIVIGMGVALLIGIGLVYVIAHFVAKFW